MSSFIDVIRGELRASRLSRNCLASSRSYSSHRTLVPSAKQSPHRPIARYTRFDQRHGLSTTNSCSRNTNFAGSDIRLLDEESSKPRKSPFEIDEAQSGLESSPFDDETSQSSASSYVPWYLEHQPEETTSIQQTAAGQEPPKIPEHAPQLLEPVVKHVFDVLGLTDVKILDLRRMTDPPPALGANLLMVVATARSERHLHASADKMCRWLRTEYKLSPFADGLLGRNEMKIAIRRRARRAKMMSAVGAGNSEEGNLEDGLRSEWICVNIGKIEGGILPEHANEDKEIIGFGTSQDSSSVVIQMMTEEKREEIDLESLWLDALRRQIRNKEALASVLNNEEIVEDDAIGQESTGPANTTMYTPLNPGASTMTTSSMS